MSNRLSRRPDPPVPRAHPCWYAAVHHAGAAAGALGQLALDFSPRYEAHGHDLIVIDVSGLDRLFGEPQRIGDELQRSAAARGLRVQVALAATRTAALAIAMCRPGVTVVRRGGEAAALASVPVGMLERMPHRPSRPGGPSSPVSSLVQVVHRWGLKTLGDLAALPAAALAARLGSSVLASHAVARGEDVAPMVPTLDEERFVAAIDLEWPIEGVEPLSFVLTRLLEPLSTRLERRDRGAAALHVTLGLVLHEDITARPFEPPATPGRVVEGPVVPVYTRTLQLPAPIRDVRTLRTLILLDLESHPPAGSIERVSIVIDPTPGRVLQHTLFTRAVPTPEQVSTLIARLDALMGGDRVGRPTRVDSSRPGAFGMKPFALGDNVTRAHRAREDHQGLAADGPVGPVSSAAPVSSACASLRRCRRPVPARVSVADARPAAVTTDRRGFGGGRVIAAAGPWRTSGCWWEPATVVGQSSIRRSVTLTNRRLSIDDRRSPGDDRPWDREEWDVACSDGAVYRIFQDGVTGGWFIDGVID